MRPAERSAVPVSVQVGMRRCTSRPARSNAAAASVIGPPASPSRPAAAAADRVSEAAQAASAAASGSVPAFGDDVVGGFAHDALGFAPDVLGFGIGEGVCVALRPARVCSAGTRRAAPLRWPLLAAVPGGHWSPPCVQLGPGQVGGEFAAAEADGITGGVGPVIQDTE